MAEDEPQEETEEPEEKVEEAEEIDIELEEAEPTRRRGSGGIWLIVLLIAVAAVAWIVYSTMEQARQQKEAADRDVRMLGYQSRLNEIGRDLGEAMEANEQGDVAAAIQGLEAAASRIGDVAASAVAAGDDEYSQVVQMKKRDAEGAVEETTAKQAELQELIAEKLVEVRKTLGVKEPVAPEAAEQPEEEEGAEEPEEEVAEEPGEEAAEEPGEEAVEEAQEEEAAAPEDEAQPEPAEKPVAEQPTRPIPEQMPARPPTRPAR